MANIAVSRIKREFKEVIKSEEVNDNIFRTFINYCVAKSSSQKYIYICVASGIHSMCALAESLTAVLCPLHICWQNINTTRN